MIANITILCALALVGGSLSPKEAIARTSDASRKEAEKLCKHIEANLSGHYAGGNFSTTIQCRHPFTAYYVGEHFKDNWVCRWNDWYPNWPVSGPDIHKPHKHCIREDMVLWSEWVDVEEWKLDMTPKP